MKFKFHGNFILLSSKMLIQWLYVIAAKFCTCSNSWAVMACAKFCSDLRASSQITTMQIFHDLIFTSNLLVKRTQGYKTTGCNVLLLIPNKHVSRIKKNEKNKDFQTSDQPFHRPESSGPPVLVQFRLLTPEFPQWYVHIAACCTPFLRCYTCQMQAGQGWLLGALRNKKPDKNQFADFIIFHPLRTGTEFRYIYIFYYWDGPSSWTLLMDDSDHRILQSQHHGCWWASDANGQGFTVFEIRR